MNVNLSISALLVAACCVAPATAAEPTKFIENQSQLTQELIQFDTNKDGVVTLAEKADAKLVEFVDMDTDKDGFWTWEEFRKYRQAKRDEHVAKMFRVTDKNTNNLLSSEEFLQVFAATEEMNNAAITRANTAFAILDSNSDAALNSAEFGVLFAATEAMPALIWQFAGLDANGDAKLAANEYAVKVMTLPKAPKLPKPKPTLPIVGKM